MDLSKKILTLLAIFCVIASAGAVCAADVSADDGYAGINYEDMNGVAGSQYQDEGGYAGSNYQDDGGWAGSQYDESQENGGWAGSNYQDDGGWAGSQYDESVENANATDSPAAGETTNMTVHAMLATGNPILLLLGISAVLGGCAVLKRK